MHIQRDTSEYACDTDGLRRAEAMEKAGTGRRAMEKVTGRHWWMLGWATLLLSEVT